MLFFLLSSVFVLSNGVSIELQPFIDEKVMVPLIFKKLDLGSLHKNGTFDAKSLIAELADADPAKIQEVISLVEAMVAAAQSDLNTVALAATEANNMYDAAVATYDAAIVAKTEGVIALETAKTQGVIALETAVTDALAAKIFAEGAKSGAQNDVTADKISLDAEVASLQNIINILQSLVSVPTVTPVAHVAPVAPTDGVKVAPTDVTVIVPTGGDDQVITGWHKAPEIINFGRTKDPEGLVGGWWLQMTLEFDYGSDITVWGFNCDYNLNPYTVQISSDGANWADVGDPMAGDYALTSSLTFRYARVQWLETSGSNGFHWAVYQ